ncbi:hypothetical protein [Streptomyces sp. 351MFTsu5.1]|uniref:hypothetical protein n=1 Tax=Streptomyces sp. 351MFTsu5.1 TaxID=1172180 RepID=UPI00131A0062|nr:hypothetical protein [Streptomyces sp. 351MFTsu5.1]
MEAFLILAILIIFGGGIVWALHDSAQKARNPVAALILGALAAIAATAVHMAVPKPSYTPPTPYRPAPEILDQHYSP